jgi:hypothetical protein
MWAVGLAENKTSRIMRYVRIASGLAAWIATGVVLAVWFRSYMLAPQADGHRVAVDLWEFASAERRVVRLQLQGNWPLEAGDPIYRIDGPDAIEQVGEIRLVDWGEPGDHHYEIGPLAEALLYPQAPGIYDRSYMTYYTTPRSMTWVMETMLPLEKRIRIGEEILYAYERYHAEILEAFRPIVASGFMDAMEVVEEDLAVALSGHREELEVLASRYQSRVVEQEIVPLVRQEIWPVVQRRAEPLANEIGQEMFERASVWRFGWRVLYDKSFLPEKNLTQQEWNRFVREEAMPVLDRHRNDLVAVQRQILEDVAQNQEVRTALRQNLSRVIDDPEFQEIVWQIFQQVVVDNPRLRQRLEQRWNTAEAQKAMQVAADYVEPCVRRIGDLLFGTRQDGIAPEFAQVLRNQILDKDCRWLVINTPVDSRPIKGISERNISERNTVLQVKLGGPPKVNPFAVQLQGMK